jgi:hypothetical protein
VSKLIQNVSFESFKTFCVENGVPGAEAFTTDFLTFNGSVAGGVANGLITQPPDVKLSDEYDYYLTEIRGSGTFLNAAAVAIGATPYMPIIESNHLGFTLNSDGRNRPSLFRGGASGTGVIPFAQVMSQGLALPFEFPAPAAFSGREKVQCVVSFIGTFNPAAVAAVTEFAITVTCAIIKSQLLVEWDRYLKSMRGR